MAASPPRPARRRPRPGSLERPVNARLYRGTWLLVGVPLLVAAFSVRKAEPLPSPQPALPPSFDRADAVALASELAQLYPDRAPGTAGAVGAAQWFRAQLAPYGLRVAADRFSAALPGRGRETLVNQFVTVPGRSPDEIAVMAHRDDGGTGPGANDNASGIATLIELARSYGAPVAAPQARAVSPLHTLVFVATDGGAFGALGARRFARTHLGHVLAVIDLTALAGRGPPRLVLAGTEPRLAAPAVVETAAERVVDLAGVRPQRPGAVAQLVDLAFPFTLQEQGPLLAQGLPALTLTSGGERPPSAFTDQPSRLDGARLAQLGGAAQQLLRWLDSGAELAPGTSTYVYFGPRILPGWAIELILIAALAPFFFATVDLYARCRRRHIRLGPALRSYRSRVGLWLWTAAIFLLFALAGVWPAAPRVPLPPTAAPATDWPVLGLLGLALLSGVGWLVVRQRLLPTRPAAASDEIAGASAALLALAVLALLVVATNPFALVFLLPSLHAWLWLPQFRRHPLWVRGAFLAAGFLGPLLLVGSVALRYHLGLDAFWYLGELTATGYVQLPAVLIAAGWLAAAGQVAALATGRYAPYPSARERPPRGPVRETVRRIVLTVRARRRAGSAERRALER
ncbi:MAG TPA: M28 family peptidase [Gaiellaceae bacterium]|nr:M28 family peptidase [Gaiellaceae bacterium]